MKLLKIPNRLRRKFLSSINKDYIKNKLSKRTGRCKKCGRCCKGCRFLDEKTDLCTVYDERPDFCHKDFPIDNLDKRVFGTTDCGYSFRD